MTRKKARHLMIELSRRMYLESHGTLKGFGKTAKFYNDNWRPNMKELRERYGVIGYKGMWNSDLMKKLRATLDM